MKKQLLLIIGLIMSVTLFASPVTSEKAKENALSFLKGNGGNRLYATAGLRNIQLKKVDMKVSDNAYYVFNIGQNEGFVITSGDDRAEAILGYSDSGSFDPNNIPENMKAWLAGYAKEINNIKTSNVEAPRMLAANAKKPYKRPVPELLTCRWNQDSPYNDKCPDYGDKYGHRPTGCVATAMAQVMYYHKWPKEATPEIPGYTFKEDPAAGGDGSSRDVAALPSIKFDWDNMVDEYTVASLKESRDAVADLMLYCGVSLKMAYHPLASGAFGFDIPNALRTYMGYDKGVRYLDGEGYTSNEWEDILYNELSNNRPVLYSGMTADLIGHQFVCDGYENGFYHFNWGWGGVSNGFFKIHALAPAVQGVGGAGDGMHFSECHQMVVGVQPPTEGTELADEGLLIGKMTIGDSKNGEYVFSEGGNASVLVDALFAFNGSKPTVFTIGFGLFDKDNKLQKVLKQVKKEIPAGYTSDLYCGFHDSVKLTKGDLQSDGTYYIRALVKNLISDEWENMLQSDKKYFEIQVEGNNIHVIPYPVVNVEIKNLRAEGSMYDNTELKIKATLVNKGEDVEGVLCLTNNNKSIKNISKDINLNRGESQDVELAFIVPAGENSYGLAINNLRFTDEIKVNIKQGETSGADIDFVPAEGFTSEGNYIEIPVELTNNSASTYNSVVNALLLSKSGYSYIIESTSTVPVEIASEGKANVKFRFDNLPFNATYKVVFSFYSYGKETFFGGLTNGVPNQIFSSYKTPDALVYYDADGKMSYKLVKEGESFEIPSNACFVEMPKAVSNRTIKKSVNPNCIYDFKPGVYSPEFKGCNIINAGKSKAINLTDEFDYYCKYVFNSVKTNITYSVKNGLSTIWMPFEADKVTCDSVELTRGYTVEDIATCDYVLLPFVEEDETTVYCDYNNDFKNTPYIMLVNPKYVGKKFVFAKTELSKLNLKSEHVYGTYFNIYASHSNVAHEDLVYGYGIKEFVKGNKRVEPFRVYLKPVMEFSAPEKVIISYPEGFVAAGIEDLSADNNGNNTADVYTVDGVKVRTVNNLSNVLEGLPSGIYIVNGKKYVK